MHAFFGVLSAILVIYCSIPYARDILSKKAIPSRSSRLMYMLLMIIGLIQQNQVDSSWALLLIGGEALQCIFIFALSIKYGIGGSSRLDLWCYGLLALDIFIWQATNSALLALHLTILADLIATWPTVTKTLKNPETESSLYFGLGSGAAILALFAIETPGYAAIAFPLYLAIINAFVCALALRKSVRSEPNQNQSIPTCP